jgi:hypothetical protein
MPLVEESHRGVCRGGVLKVGRRIDVCDDQGVGGGRGGCRVAEGRGGTVMRVREEGAAVVRARHLLIMMQTSPSVKVSI